MRAVLSAHQPAYMPWLGYFDKILRSDIFIFLDTVQFEKNSFINRNQIKTPQGPLWLTIPVKNKGHMSSTLRETEMDSRQNWRRKHLKSIWTNYRKAPRFDVCFPKLEKLYQEPTENLSDFCFQSLLFWMKELGIQRNIVRAKTLDIVETKSDLVLALCSLFHADVYLSGALGKSYLKEEDFKNKGIEVIYQNYSHPVYPQLHGAFLPNLSIVDFWMNADANHLILGEI